jgi:hypothetical protein
MALVGRATVIAITVLIAADPATAQPYGYEYLSNGQDSCGEFVAGGSLRQQVDVEWILGFISGVNSRGAIGDRMVGRSIRDIDAIAAWVQHYCQSHALDIMPTVAEALRNELARREGRQQ